jgi:Flp pilus assembly protein TadD
LTATIRRGIFLLLLGIPASVSLRAEEKWIKLSTPHFEMFTPNGEKRAKEALLQFEQVRTFFRQATNKGKDDNTGTRVRIVAFRGEKDYKPYRMNEGAAAFYLRNESHDYIVMGDVEEEHFLAAAHEYTHLVVEHAGYKFPLWLNEGLADVYSTLEAQGDKTMVGKPIKGRLIELQQTNWLSLPALFSVGVNSPYYNEKDKMSVFYAESWLLAHMLMLSPDYVAKFPQFLITVNHGARSEDALLSVYGKDVNAVMSDLRHYMTGKTVRVSLVNVKFEKSDFEPEVTTPDDLELRLTLADILIGLHRLDPAREALTRLANAHPDQPQVEETRFDLAWQSRDMKGAAEHCERAFTLGSKNVQMLNSCMAVEYQQGGTRKNLLPMLQRVAELQPGDSEVHIRLGLELVNEQKFGQALVQFADVKSVKPEMAFAFYSASGYAKLRLGSDVESRKDWELAKKYAKNETEVQSAERFLSSIANQASHAKSPNQTSAVAREETAPVFKMDSSSPADEPSLDRPSVRLKREEQQRADGVLTLIDCAGEGWRMHLKTASGELVFFIASANDILIKSADDTESFTFTCGTQMNKTATVYYVAKPDMPSVTGVARRLELK